MAIVAGIVISAIGSANIYAATTPANRATFQHLQEAGSLILLLALILITLYALKTRFTLGRQSRSSGSSKHHRQSKLPAFLVDAAIVALPFLYARVIYGIVYAFTQSRKLSPITGEFVIQVVLITVVQSVAALILLVGGLVTMNITRDAVVPGHREDA